jgi:HK97 family phage major capsid protein
MKTEQEKTVDVIAERKQAADEANAQVASILKMGVDYNARDEAQQAVIDGKTAEQFRQQLLDQLNKRTSKPLGEQGRDAEIGMSEKEARKFSFIRALRHLADPGDKSLRDEAAFELECSAAAKKQYGKTSRGITVPNDVLVRAFTTTTPSGATGANIIATELLAASFIDLLRNRSVVMPLVTKLGGLVGNVDIPRQKSATTGYWVGEATDVTASQVGTDKISLTPHTVGATSEISRRLLEQSTPDAEALTREDIIKVLALAIDYAAIYGSGSSGQPTGVKNVSGIGGVDFAAAAVGNAAKPTFLELVAMETAVAAANADIGSLAYITNAATRGHMKSTLKFSSAGSATLWEQGDTANGYKTLISNQIAAGDMFFGNFADVLMGMWGGLDLLVNPYALDKQGGLRITALQDIDIALRHVESFCWGSASVA